MPSIEGIQRDIADLRIQQVGLGRTICAIRRSCGVIGRVASVQELVPIDDLIDAVTAAAIAKVHAILRYARRVHIMSAGRWIGDAFVAGSARSVVTALLRSD